MLYQEFLDLYIPRSNSREDLTFEKFSVHTPRALTRDIGKFRAVNARNFKDLKELHDIANPFESVCIFPENIAQKYEIVSGEYYLFSTSEELAQNKTRGSGMEFSGEREFLYKAIRCPNTEKFEDMGEIVLVPDLVLHNLGITKNSYIAVKKVEESLNDQTLEAGKSKKDFPIKIAKKIICRSYINKYQKYVTPELIHTLLKEKHIKVINKSETIVLNFYHKINEQLVTKLSKTKKSKFIRLNASKLTTPEESFCFFIKIRDAETNPPQDPDQVYLDSSFLFDQAHTSITLENASLNMYFPIKKLPFSSPFSPEFIKTLTKDPYLHKCLKMLKNIFRTSIQCQNKFSSSNIIAALSYPHGLGLSLLVKHLASSFGFNYLEKNVRECYSLQEIEKTVLKGVYMRPSVILFKKFLHLKAFLDQKAAISHSNSLGGYIEHLSALIKSTVVQSSDGFPCLIIFAESSKEKVDQVYAEVAETFNYGLHIEPPSESEHLETLKGLLKWFDVTMGDTEELGTISKGLSWKQIYKIFQAQHSKGDSETFKIKDIKTTIEKTKKDSNMVNSLNIPNVTWDDVGGLLEAKNEIIDTIMLPQWYPQLFQNKIKPRTGILFFGPPGTGKTMLAKAVANECKMNFMSVKGPELLNMYVGESEKNVREIFDKARSNLPCIIFFDELDALVPNRGHGSDSSQVMDRIVAQFLTEIDGLQKEGGLFIIGATNRPDLLDPSLLRPGRFDKMVYLGINEDVESRVKILEAQTRKFKLDSDVDFIMLEKEIPKNFTGADFYALTSGAILKAVRRKIADLDQKFQKEKETGNDLKTFEEWSRDLPKDDLAVQVSNQDFITSLSGITPSVSVKELSKYTELRKKYALN